MRVPAVWAALWAIFWCFSSRPAVAQSEDYDCNAFFDEVASLWAPLVRHDIDSSSLAFEEALTDAMFEAHTLSESKFLAVEFDAPDPPTEVSTNPLTIARPMAFCSSNPFTPNALVLTQDAMIAMANAKWNSTEQANFGRSRHAFIFTEGAGVFLKDVTLKEAALVDGEMSSLVLLADADGTTRIENLTITDQADLLTLIQHDAQNGSRFYGEIKVVGTDWAEVGEKSSLYNVRCTVGDPPIEDPCDGSMDGSDASLEVVNSSFAGVDGVAAHATSFIEVKGALNLSNAEVKNIDFGDDVPAIESSQHLVSQNGSAFVDLNGFNNRPLMRSLSGPLEMSHTLIGDVSQWTSLAKAKGEEGLRIRESYICGVSETKTLFKADGTNPASMEVLTTAVIGTRLTKALLLAEAPTNEIFLANMLLLNVEDASGSGDKRLSLIGPDPATTSVQATLTNLLASDSLLSAVDAATHDLTHDAVRIWPASTSTATDECDELRGSDGDCLQLTEAPVFTSDDLLRDSDDPKCGAPLDTLRRAIHEDAVNEGSADETVDATTLEALLPALPVLSTDQTDLVGTGADWESADGACKSGINPEDPVDIGAYGGTCSLAFLAPIGDEIDPGDTGHGSGPTSDTGAPTAGDTDSDSDGTADTGTPDAGATPSTVRFGLGAGCRYSAAALLLPLGLLARRRRRSTPV